MFVMWFHAEVKWTEGTFYQVVTGISDNREKKAGTRLQKKISPPPQKGWVILYDYSLWYSTQGLKLMENYNSLIQEEWQIHIPIRSEGMSHFSRKRP